MQNSEPDKLKFAEEAVIDVATEALMKKIASSSEQERSDCLDLSNQLGASKAVASLLF